MPEPGWCATRTCPATTLVMASRSGKPSEGQLTRKAPSRSSKNSPTRSATSGLIETRPPRSGFLDEGEFLLMRPVSSSRVLRRILVEATTVQSSDTTFANQAHLSNAFLAQIVGLYENTRLGRQEIYDVFRNYCRKRRRQRVGRLPGRRTPGRRSDERAPRRHPRRHARGRYPRAALPQMHASQGCLNGFVSPWQGSVIRTKEI